MALQAAGESTSSLGEIRNRSDLVIYWGSNPVESHPRHLERFVEAPGLFTPRGRADRHLVVVDVERTATAELADTFIKVAPGGDFDVLWTLRGLVRGAEIQGDHFGGVPLAQLRRFAERMIASRYGALFFGLGITHHREMASIFKALTPDEVKAAAGKLLGTRPVMARVMPRES